MSENESLCEHGNYHCLICEIRLLKQVIEEQRKLLVESDSMISFLHYRGYIQYGKQGCPEPNEIDRLIGKLRT